MMGEHTMTEPTGTIVDLSTSPKAQPAPTYTGLGRELHVVNARFLNPFVATNWSGAMVSGFDGWAIRFGNVEIVSADYAKTENLSQAVNLNGSVFGEIEQELLTTPGHRVTIKLRAGHNSFGSCPQQEAKFSIQVNEDPSTRTTYNLGVLAKLVSQPATSNYWHKVTYTFRAKGYDVLQLRGDPDGGVCGVVVTEVRAFEQPWA
jgi:hypothetical protein